MVAGWECGDQERLLLRVHKQHPMDRELPNTAVLAGLGVKVHLDTPLCMEHAGQRVSEYLFKHIQDIVINEGGNTVSKQRPVVNRLNAALFKHGANYCINFRPAKDGVPEGWHAVKFNGKVALSVTAKASYWSEHQQRKVGWLHDMWGDTPKAAGSDARGLSWLAKMAAVWEQWNNVLLEGRTLEPSPDVVEGFGAKCRTLYRYAPQARLPRCAVVRRPPPRAHHRWPTPIRRRRCTRAHQPTCLSKRS